MGRSEAEHAAMRREAKGSLLPRVAGTTTWSGQGVRVAGITTPLGLAILLLILLLAFGCGAADDRRPVDGPSPPSGDPGVVEQVDLPATIPPGESP